MQSPSRLAVALALSALLCGGCGGSGGFDGPEALSPAVVDRPLSLNRSSLVFESQLDGAAELALDLGEVAILQSDDGTERADDSGTAWTDELWFVAPPDGAVTFSLDSPFLKGLAVHSADGAAVWQLPSNQQKTLELEPGARYKLVLEDSGAPLSAQTSEGTGEGAYAVRFQRVSGQPFIDVGQTLSGADFDDIDFSQQDLSGLDFAGAWLTRCSFIGSKLRDTVFFNARFTECEFVEPEIAGTDFRQAQFESGTVFRQLDLSSALLKDALWTDARVSETVFAGGALDKLRFTRTSLNNVNFRSAGMNFVTFFDSTLVNVDFSHSLSRRLIFLRCRASGTDRDSGLHFDGATLRDLSISSSQMAFVSFREAVFQAPVSVSNSDLSNATFLHAVGFEQIDLLNVVLDGALGPQGRVLP